jgi:hypothetical protein
MSAIRRPYLAQLRERSKNKTISAQDLHAITTQIWLTSDDFDTLINEKTITAATMCQFYLDFHESEDIDERLNKVNIRCFD